MKSAARKWKRLDRDKRIATMAGMIPNQTALDTLLLPVEDPFKRKAIFDYMKPHIRRFDATFPTPNA